MRLIPERVAKAVKLWGCLPRVVRLCWDACPLATFFEIFFNLLGRLLPLGSLYVTKLIIDSVVGHRAGDALGIVALFILLTGLGQASSQVQFGIYVYSRNRLPIHTSTILQEKINSFKGIALFEHSGFHDALENARRGSGRLSLNMLGGTFANVWELATIAALMLKFHVLVPVIVFATMVPRAVLQSFFSAEEWNLSRLSATEARKMEYFSGLIIGDAPAKEVRLFGLGKTFLSTYRDLFSSLYGHLHSIRIHRTGWNGLTALISVCGTGGVYVFLALRAATGAITVGDLVLYTGLLFRLHQSLLHTTIGIDSLYKRLLDMGCTPGKRARKSGGHGSGTGYWDRCGAQQLPDESLPAPR